MIAVGVCVMLWGWCLLSLGLARHHEVVFARAARAGSLRAMRASGWASLLLGLAWFVFAKGWVQGPIFAGAALIVAAIIWVLLMTLWPRRSVATLGALSIVALVGWMIA